MNKKPYKLSFFVLKIVKQNSFSKLKTYYAILKQQFFRTNTPFVYDDLIESLYTSPKEAIAIIQIRRKDEKLQSKVTAYLNEGIPKHFTNDEPILYLSRHLATPNLETLKFIEIAKEFDLPIIIGEDHKGKFVSTNADKRSLGKMQIVKGVNRWKDEVIENFSIIDFKTNDGKRLNEIKTIFNESLIEFHHNLIHEVYPNHIKIYDESDWIDNNYRTDILEQYKRFLALMILNGIMFEIYYPEDRLFVEKYVIPAFKYIEIKFGVKPLICNIFQSSKYEKETDWIKYPSIIYPFVSAKVKPYSHHK